MRLTPPFLSLVALSLASCALPAPAPIPVSPLAAIPDGSVTVDLPASRPESAMDLAFASAPVPGGGDKGLLGSGGGYTIAKLGPFYGRGDLEDLDTGFWGELIFGDEFLSFLALEAAVGYVSAEGPRSTELWGVPIFVQARASLPVLIFEPYAGVGIGGMYVKAETGPSTDASDFVLAGNGFLGVAVGLGNLSVGVEGKYLITDEVDSQFKVEGASGVLFLSVPF